MKKVVILGGIRMLDEISSSLPISRTLRVLYASLVGPAKLN